MKTITVTLLLAVVCCGASAAEAPESLSLNPVTESLSIDEINAALSVLGLDTKRFDYEVGFDHCLDFTATVPAGDGSSASESGSHLCHRAGAYRLMIVRTRDSGTLAFSVHSSSRDRSSSGWMTLGTFESKGGVEYGRREGDLELLPDQTVPLWESEVVVEVTLKPNPKSRDGFSPAPYSVVYPAAVDRDG